MNQAVTDGGRNPAYKGRFNDETPEMHLIRLAQARRIAELESERAALLRIKEAADVLYSETEEYDLPDGLGMGASQQYWDDLANALFPDDSGEIIQADLEKVQSAVDGAWEAFSEEINKPEFLQCGHHHSLMLKSAETGKPLYCEYCDCISQRNDFEAERDAAAEAEREACIEAMFRWDAQKVTTHRPAEYLRVTRGAMTLDAIRKESGNG